MRATLKIDCEVVEKSDEFQIILPSWLNLSENDEVEISW